MADWKGILDEVKSAGSPIDLVRRKYLRQLHELTGRNVIVYYSGWLEKADLVRQGMAGFELNDGDKNGFMAAIHQLDRSLGLDLILHTPGGDTAATESLVNYLRAMFGTNIRAVVPQLAMSAGTMIALACKEIVMGKHSSLGPIDPQLGGLPAHGVIEEFQRAVAEIAADPNRIPVWQPIIAKYSPTLIGECEKAIKRSEEMVTEWLSSGMFDGLPDCDEKTARVVTELGSHALTKSHARHLDLDRVKSLELNVVALEDDSALQDAVLSVHHACIHTLSQTTAFKIIENHLGNAFIQQVQVVGLPA